MKFTVYRECFFSSAHHLRNYNGKCENIHGHNWRVRVYVSKDNLDDDGFVIDFKALDKIINETADILDHQDINSLAPFDKLNPTAENIALYFYEKCGKLIKDFDPQLSVGRVMIWESEKSCAIVEK